MVCLIPLWWLSLDITAPDKTPVLAIGDMHGAYPEFSAVLLQTGLIDGNGKWHGGGILIQTGEDLLSITLIENHKCLGPRWTSRRLHRRRCEPGIELDLP